MSSRRSAILAISCAAFATVAALVVTSRFGDDANRSLTERYRGEQWDVARACLLGAQTDRSEPAEAIAARLAVRALDATVEAAEGEGLERERLWPARCGGALVSLREAGESAGPDAEPRRRALAELEVLLPRVLPADVESARQLDPSAIVERALELGAPIRVLDLTMPAGGVAPSTAEPRPGGDEIERLLASIDAPLPAARPALPSRANLETLLDVREDGEISRRLSRSDDEEDIIERSGPDGSSRERLDLGEAWRAARLTEAGELLAFDPLAGRLGFVASSGGEVRAIEWPAARGLDALGSCDAGADTHLLLRRGEALEWVRWSDRERPPSLPPAPLERVAESAVVRVGCDSTTLALAHRPRAGGEWALWRCAGRACERLPTVAVGPALSLVVDQGEVAVISRARRAPLLVSRRLVDGEWAAPRVSIQEARRP